MKPPRAFVFYTASIIKKITALLSFNFVPFSRNSCSRHALHIQARQNLNTHPALTCSLTYPLIAIPPVTILNQYYPFTATHPFPCALILN